MLCHSIAHMYVQCLSYHSFSFSFIFSFSYAYMSLVFVSRALRRTHIQIIVISTDYYIIIFQHYEYAIRLKCKRRRFLLRSDKMLLSNICTYCGGGGGG